MATPGRGSRVSKEQIERIRKNAVADIRVEHMHDDADACEACGHGLKCHREFGCDQCPCEAYREPR